jgi:hypothetical protein
MSGEDRYDVFALLVRDHAQGRRRRDPGPIVSDSSHHVGRARHDQNPSPAPNHARGDALSALAHAHIIHTGALPALHQSPKQKIWAALCGSIDLLNNQKRIPAALSSAFFYTAKSTLKMVGRATENTDLSYIWYICIHTVV